MKSYNQTNFFKHTFCEFLQIDDFQFPESNNYKSKSDSSYYYTKEGVYRKSNHWGRVANCRWKLKHAKNYKNQQTVIGFAKWTDFYPINSTEKTYFLKVDFDQKTVEIQPKDKKNTNHLYTHVEAQKRKKQVQQLLKDDKWANYFDQEIEELRFKIITDFISSNKSLQEIKIIFK